MGYGRTPSHPAEKPLLGSRGGQEQNGDRSPGSQPSGPGLRPPLLGACRGWAPFSLSLWGWVFSRIQHLGAEIHLIRDMMDPIHTGGLYDFLLTALEVRVRALGQRQKYSGPWGRHLLCPGHCCGDDPRFTARMCFCGEGPTGSLVLPLLKGLGKGSLLHPSPWVPGTSSMFQAVPGCLPEHNRRGEAPFLADHGRG